MVTRLFFTVYFGPKRRLGALAVFLLCEPADSDSSFGPYCPTVSPPRRIVPSKVVYLGFIFPPPYLAHCSRRRLLSFVAFLTSRKSVDGGDDVVVRPYSPGATDRRLLSPDAALESPEAGWCDRFSRGQLTVGFPVCSCGLFAHVHCRSQAWSQCYANMVNPAVCMNLITEYLLNLFAALPATHRETAALYLSVSAHTPNIPAAYLRRGREG